jgi:argininosuccinate lyase
MPSSFGMWFSAYAETLIDDITMLNAALKLWPKSIRLSRRLEAPLLIELYNTRTGFWNFKIQFGSRSNESWKIRKTVAFMSSVATSLKFTMDVCLYMSQILISLLPSHLTTGSSIMPHKKDVFELIRGKCNKIQALLKHCNKNT